MAADILRSVAFLSGVLDGDSLDKLATAADTTEFAKGAVLMRQGDLGQSMFIIVDGEVAISVHERGGDQKVATLGPGEIVGEMSLLTGSRRSATVTATRKTRVLEIDKSALQPIFAASKKLADRFAGMVEQRNAELRQRHANAERWNNVGLGRAEVAARMTAFYSG